MLLKLHFKLDDWKISSHITDLLWLSNCAYYKFCTFSVFSIILFLEPKHLSLLVIGACQSGSCSFQILSELLFPPLLFFSAPELCCLQLLLSAALLLFFLALLLCWSGISASHHFQFLPPPYLATVCSSRRTEQ